MKLKHFQLILNVSIDPQGETTLNLDRQLHRVVSNAVNNGLLTGNTPATVETYNYTIKQVRSVKKKKPCKKCGTGLDKTGFCKDITCPYSEFPQTVSLEDLHESKAEQQRRDEKNGLYGGVEDVAN